MPSIALLTLAIAVPMGAAAPLPLGGDPRVKPDDFRVTVFADGLNYPMGMVELADGSILVATSRPNSGTSGYFSSTGELLRLVDVDGDGVADETSVLFTGLPGGLGALKRAGDLILVISARSGSEGISILRTGPTPADPLTLVGSIDVSFVGGTEHKIHALTVRPSVATPGGYDVVFNLGARTNDEATTDLATLSGLLTGTIEHQSLYMFTLEDHGASVTAGGLTQLATGLRNAAGLAFDPITGDLYLQDNGIDLPTNRNEPLSADEINRIAAGAIGGAVENFGFPDSYVEYRTGNVVGGTGIAPLVAIQPIGDPLTGAEAEGAVEIAFAPASFPDGLNRGLFIGFHGLLNFAGPTNNENPLVYLDLDTLEYFHIVPGGLTGVGHLDSLLTTSDSLFIADMTAGGDVGRLRGPGAIYQIKVLQQAVVPEPGSAAVLAVCTLATLCIRRRCGRFTQGRAIGTPTRSA